MSQSDRTKIEDRLGDSGEVAPVTYEISSYGADFLVDGLVRRLRDGDIFIPAFQRGFVWTYRQASRFIESFLLGLPVPGIFLSKDFDSQRLLVIDGHQRLKTLQFFCDGVFADSGRVFSLRGVQTQFEGLTYGTLRDEDKRRLNDSVVHATVVKQEAPPEDDSSIYYIFERLNTTGTPLLPQEIRHCIYRGEFNELLKDLNQMPPWRSVYGRVDKRMRDEELILRFLALHFNAGTYERPMKEFLNRFMAGNRHLQLQPAGELAGVFAETIGLFDDVLGHRAFRPVRALNAAVFDSVMVGVASRLEAGGISDVKRLEDQYEALLSNEEFQETTQRSTADEVNVAVRLQMATEAFADVE
ncbi:MAG: hypothetical protein CEE40_01205 [Chloroflexi bacterium B3_Chlor]|nr:MAG: hypothetical protein CEE40_01205 [Chloroflexi bacterium B3_Chlor]